MPGQSPSGRLAIPAEMMVRILVLKQLFNLPDEQMVFRLLHPVRYKPADRTTV